MRNLGWALPLAIGLLAPSFASATCIPGTKLIDNQKDSSRVAIGRDSVSFTKTMTEIPLSHRPDYADTQVYTWVIAPRNEGPLATADWCYDTETNSVKFTQNPPRLQTVFSNDGQNEYIPLPEGSEIWVGYYSHEEYDPSCILGNFLNYLPGDPVGGSTFGQEFFTIDAQASTYVLKNKPMDGHQMYLIGSNNMWVYAYDWCYSPAENSIHFMRNPIRTYDLGGIPGMEVREGFGFWLGYVPQP
jgi:hypothetical protein